MAVLVVDQAAATGPGLRGLFCGGTLADEAMLIAAERLGGIRSNIPLSPELALGPDLRDPGHVVIDFGDDVLTQGRAHPMIDPSLRLERIAAEARDETCGVLLLDSCSATGPTRPRRRARRGRASRTGHRRRGRAGAPGRRVAHRRRGDPQGLKQCATALQEAGAPVFLSNAQATRHALSLLPGQEN